MDGGRNEEETGGGPILEVHDGTEDLDANQPQHHCISWSLVSLILV